MNDIDQTYKQFPLRLRTPLANALDQVSKDTKIPKTELSRIAITKFLHELENSGIRKSMLEVCEV